MKINIEEQVGEIVAHDYRIAAVFKSKGIDFCCRGNRSLKEVILEKDLDKEALLKDLEYVTAEKSDSLSDFESWPVDLLADYIEKKHHRYVRVQIPVLNEYLHQITKAHGKAQPVLNEIKTEFLQGAEELLIHMEEEETMLFPVIRNLVAPPVADGPSCVPPSILDALVKAMMMDHKTEGDRWKKIAELTDQYHLQFGCNVALVTFALLREFENDLHKHIHLENNILFPMAIRIRKEKTKALQS